MTAHLLSCRMVRACAKQSLRSSVGWHYRIGLAQPCLDLLHMVGAICSVWCMDWDVNDPNRSLQVLTSLIYIHKFSLLTFPPTFTCQQNISQTLPTAACTAPRQSATLHLLFQVRLCWMTAAHWFRLSRRQDERGKRQRDVYQPALSCCSAATECQGRWHAAAWHAVLSCTWDVACRSGAAVPLPPSV